MQMKTIKIIRPINSLMVGGQVMQGDRHQNQRALILLVIVDHDDAAALAQ